MHYEMNKISILFWSKLILTEIRVTHHILHRKQCVDVQHISPPIFRAIHMVHRWWIEDGVVLEIFHGYLNHAEDKHVRGGQSNETVHDQSEEMECSGRDFAHTLRQLLQVTLCIGPEVDVWNEEATETKGDLLESTLIDWEKRPEIVVWLSYLMKKNVSTL